VDDGLVVASSLHRDSVDIVANDDCIPPHTVGGLWNRLSVYKVAPPPPPLPPVHWIVSPSYFVFRIDIDFEIAVIVVVDDHLQLQLQQLHQH